MDNKISTSGRSCGGCTACCYTHEVGEIRKYSFDQCNECMGGKGCRIYSTRPSGCAEFLCMWLSGEVGSEEQRPDKIGVVCSDTVSKQTKNDPPTILMMEAREGALEEAPVKSFMRELLRSGTSVKYGSRSIPRFSYHVLRHSSMEAFGQMLENKGRRVIWHQP